MPAAVLDCLRSILMPLEPLLAWLLLLFELATDTLRFLRYFSPVVAVVVEVAVSSGTDTDDDEENS